MPAPRSSQALSHEEIAGLLRQTIDLAARHSQARAGGPFGTLIVSRGRVVGRGWNKVTSSNDPTAHAEIVAIRSAARKLGNYQLKGCILFASCEPCPMCLAAAYWARIDRIIYAAGRSDAAAIGFDDANLYREIARPLKSRRIPMTQSLRAEAVKMMTTWAESPGRILY